MPLQRDSHRIVIAGASSLLGAELKSLLEESRFAGRDLSLVDEEIAAGTLTEAGGEAAVIQPVEEGTFSRARIIFFTGSPEFTSSNFQAARDTGAVIIDLSSHSTTHGDSFIWFSRIEQLRPQSLPSQAHLATIPSAATEAVVRLTLSLKQLDLRDLTAVVFQPVSAAGKAGVEELETQTGQLLSFQAPGKQVFDTQVAFNMLDRFGSGSRIDLRRRALSDLQNQIYAVLRDHTILPAVQLIHAPVFYGMTFTACAVLDPSADLARVRDACQRAGFCIVHAPETPSNITVAGESMISLAEPEPNREKEGAWWFWGAADNIRLPAWNAVKLAEKLVG